MTAHQRHQLTANGQSQSGAAVLARRERVGLAKGIEYLRLRLLRNADTGIGDLEAQSLVADGPDPHDDFSGIGEFDGIAHEVDQHLPQAGGIAAHRAGHVEIDRAGQFQTFRMSPRCENLDGLLDRIAQREFDVLQFELAGLHLREIQDVVDDLQQCCRGMGNGFREMPLPRRKFGRLQKFRHSHDAIHRRADLVAHARQEFALGAAGPFRGVLGPGCLADGELELEIGVAQIDGAFLNLLLEELAVFFQARVAVPNLRPAFD